MSDNIIRAAPMQPNPKGGPAKILMDSPVQQEAIARLEFLARQGSACGLLLGAAGTGKSVLLAHFARQLQRQGPAPALLSGHFERTAALFELAAQWGAAPDDRHDAYALWRLVSDRLIEHRYQERGSAVLVDDAEWTQPEASELLLQLVASAAAATAPLVIVLALRPENLVRVDPRLLNLVDLRIELDPWQTEATLQLDDLADPPGHLSELPALDPAAVQRLHELSQRLPPSLPPGIPAGVPLAAGSS
jgi:type II secretory pathway predicted ATPase ExeA